MRWLPALVVAATLTACGGDDGGRVTSTPGPTARPLSCGEATETAQALMDASDDPQNDPAVLQALRDQAEAC